MRELHPEVVYRHSGSAAMGTQIDASRGNAAAVRDYSDQGRPRNAGDAQSVRVRFRRDDPAEVRAGFGDGTLSPSGAALRTVNSNLAVARRLVPSVEELREAARQRAAEQAATLEQRAPAAEREAAAAAQAATTPPEAVPFRPEPSAQARAFTREDAPAPRPAAARDEAPTGPAAPPRFDVLA
jgi:hypothetical protein